MWSLIDPQGVVQGPFERALMRQWFEQGYFESKTPVRDDDNEPFRLLGERFRDESPFVDEQEATGSLFACCAQGKLKAALALLEAGADPHWTNHNKMTCLCVVQGAALCRALVEAGADVAHRNIWHQTPLHCAAEFNAADVVRTLVDLGADLHAADLDGFTPLHLACRTDARDAVRALLVLGARTDIGDAQDWTPAMHALEQEDDDLVEMLRSGFE